MPENEPTQLATAPRPEDDDMPAEIDFSNGTRGKFAKPDTTMKLPLYLDPDLEAYLAARASARGVDVGQRTNESLNTNNISEGHVSEKMRRPYREIF